MAIIGKVERKNWRVKLLNAAIHLILLLGAATMVYPLLLLISGSIKSDVDFYSFSIFPEYIYRDSLLYKKYLLTKYNGQNVLMFNQFRLQIGSLDHLEPPEYPSRSRFADYKQFLTSIRQTHPHYWRGIGMACENGVVPLTLREYRAWLVRKFGPGPKGLAALNEAYRTNYGSWSGVALPSEDFLTRRAETAYDTPLLRDLLAFKNSQITGFNTLWTDIDAPYVASLRLLAGNRLDELNRRFGTSWNTWSEITLPTEYPASAAPALAEHWRNYVCDQLNLVFITLDPAAESCWHDFLRKKYKNDLLSFNRANRTEYSSFDLVPMPRTLPASGLLRTEWSDFILEGLPPQYIHLTSLVSEYRAWLRRQYGSLDRVNRQFELGFRSFEEIALPEYLVSDNLNRGRDWLAFVASIEVEDTGLSRSAINAYRDFMAAAFTKNGVTDYKALSLAFKREITSPRDIPFYAVFPTSPDITSTVKDLYQKFILNPENASSRRLILSDKLRREWQKFLREKYHGDIQALNRAWSMVYTDWEKISPPAAEYEWFTVLDNRGMLIREYLKRNYLMVFDTIQTNGFAAKNTLIYCLLAVLASLLVNPLCAYGLSRFRMAPAYKILLFLLLPMAFPTMVLGIPQFLLIKKLGLLNTFAALILPTMANGYMIFLLKGFFDSLPRELFESAELDGASEWTIFWHVAMSLSTPILSVLVLNTFTAAYGNFMMAFLLCQDQSMWTMMVYLYQLQQHSSQAVGFAALIVAAIPTLLVFIFCQNIIIKGIVVPSEK
ncbi:MAG: beta-galactosidase [Lentisphaeria bacterium]|nr:beta-galactosidase [Lentisphaeria bacterium]